MAVPVFANTDNQKLYTYTVNSGYNLFESSEEGINVQGWPSNGSSTWTLTPDDNNMFFNGYLPTASGETFTIIAPDTLPNGFIFYVWPSNSLLKVQTGPLDYIQGLETGGGTQTYNCPNSATTQFIQGGGFWSIIHGSIDNANAASSASAAANSATQAAANSTSAAASAVSAAVSSANAAANAASAASSASSASGSAIAAATSVATVATSAANANTSANNASISAAAASVSAGIAATAAANAQFYASLASGVANVAPANTSFPGLVGPLTGNVLQVFSGNGNFENIAAAGGVQSYGDPDSLLQSGHQIFLGYDGASFRGIVDSTDFGKVLTTQNSQLAYGHDMGDTSGTIPTGATYVYSSVGFSASRTWTLPPGSAYPVGARIVILSNGAASGRLVILPQSNNGIWIPQVAANLAYYVIVGNYGETTFTNIGNTWITSHNGADTILVSGTASVTNNSAPTCNVSLPPGLWECHGSVSANSSANGGPGSSYIAATISSASGVNYLQSSEPTFSQGLAPDRYFSPTSLGKAMVGPYLVGFAANTTLYLNGQCDLSATVFGTFRIIRKA